MEGGDELAPLYFICEVACRRVAVYLAEANGRRRLTACRDVEHVHRVDPNGGPLAGLLEALKLAVGEPCRDWQPFANQ